MADIFETRCASEEFRGSNHLLRVACIGDSMLYGQGVAPRHTLPAHLARMLNAALPEALIWCDNFGQSSGNAWHAWPPFMRRRQTMYFDALVFTICQNDIQIFESNTIRYAGYDELWKADTAQRRALIALLADVAATCRAAALPAVVVFYSNTDSDRPFIDWLKPAMQALRLPFIDMLEHYRTRTTITAESYRTTEFDGHPSALAQELAARRVAQEILPMLADMPRAGLAQRPLGTLAAALDDLVSGGVPADLVLDWAAEAIAAKERAARRTCTDAGRALAGAMDGWQRLLAAAAERWRLARAMDARLIGTTMPNHSWSKSLSGLYATLRNLDELAYLLRSGLHPAVLSELGALYADGYYDQRGRLEFFTGDVVGNAVELRSRIARLPFLSIAVDRTAILPRAGGALAGGLRPLVRGLELDEATRYAERVAAHLEELAATVPVAPDEPGHRRLCAVALALARDAVLFFEQIALPFSDLPAPIEARPWLAVEVVLEGMPDETVAGSVCSLRVEAEYAVPTRLMRCEAHWAGVAKPRATYTFELPTMQLGTLRVGVSDNEPTRERFVRGTTRIAAITVRQVACGEAQAPLPPLLEWQNDGRNLPVIEFAGFRSV